MPVKRTTKKAVLVTAAGKRIGQGIALALAEDGYRIALHCHRSQTAAQKTQREIRRKGGTCVIFPCDLADEKQAQGLIPAVLREFSNLHLLINNASLFEKDNLRTGDIGVFNRHWAINLKAPYLLTSSFARHCRQGHIINILDTHIAQNRISHVSYLLSKKALAELTGLAAVELAPDIRVNAVAPGLILPPAGSGPEYLDRLARHIPLKRKGKVDHISQTIRFLIQNDYLTGQIIYVDGGEHLG